jgi:hypothetical protein
MIARKSSHADIAHVTLSRIVSLPVSELQIVLLHKNSPYTISLSASDNNTLVIRVTHLFCTASCLFCSAGIDVSVYLDTS